MEADPYGREILEPELKQANSTQRREEREGGRKVGRERTEAPEAPGHGDRKRPAGRGGVEGGRCSVGKLR